MLYGQIPVMQEAGTMTIDSQVFLQANLEMQRQPACCGLQICVDR